ncbi:cystatin-like [Hemitrygon akajei]|uniref:cystatin-like n=1 Tax=Hemitrygon akajei TaxID=2704970 RepID=UPI003BF978A9
MAPWQLAFAVFSVALLYVCAETKHRVQEIEQLAQTQHGNPLLLKVDTSDNQLQYIANLALEEFSSEKGSLFRIMQYVDTKAQVLEGILYMMDVFIGKTSCPAVSAGVNGKDCKIIQSTGASEFFMCHFVLWSIPPSKKQTTLKRSCVKINI